MHIAARSASMPFSIGNALVLPRHLVPKTKNGLMSLCGPLPGLKVIPHLSTLFGDHRLPAIVDSGSVGRPISLSVSVR